MSRKSDLRKVMRATVAAAKADQAKRLAELERSMACAAMLREFRGEPEAPPVTDNGVPLRRKPRTILEGI